VKVIVMRPVWVSHDVGIEVIMLLALVVTVAGTVGCDLSVISRFDEHEQAELWRVKGMDTDCRKRGLRTPIASRV